MPETVLISPAIDNVWITLCVQRQRLTVSSHDLKQNFHEAIEVFVWKHLVVLD